MKGMWCSRVKSWLQKNDKDESYVNTDVELLMRLSVATSIVQSTCTYVHVVDYIVDYWPIVGSSQS